MALTDVAIRNAKPGEKAIKLADGAGMFLLVTPAGGELWRLKYRIDGREKLLAIGAYPEIGLSDARKRREEARALIAQGKDPLREKQRDKVRSRIQAADTFGAIVNEYCAKRKRDGKRAGHPPRPLAANTYYLCQPPPSGSWRLRKLSLPTFLWRCARSKPKAIWRVRGLPCNWPVWFSGMQSSPRGFARPLPAICVARLPPRR